MAGSGEGAGNSLRELMSVTSALNQELFGSFKVEKLKRVLASKCLRGWVVDEVLKL